MPHMPATGVSGVDLYMKDADGQALWCAGKYSFGDTVRYTYDNLTYRRQSDKGNEFCLYLPLYNGVNLMEIGVPAGSHFEFAAPSKKKPVVIYGTSIAQEHAPRVPVWPGPIFCKESSIFLWSIWDFPETDA